MRAPLIVALALVLFSASAFGLDSRESSDTQEPRIGCLTAREFITTLEFLRDRKEFHLPENEAQKVAEEVARGCTGAARRYIRVARVLTEAGLGTGDALQAARGFAAKLDFETDAFLSIFNMAFSAEGLDLDIGTSVRMAKSLSVDFPGDVLKARDDFETLTHYCTDAKKLALPKPQCASFASDIARQGQSWAGSAASAWIRIFEFLSLSKDGPTLATDQAMRVARQTVEAGPDSADNFVHAFRYASSKKGLDLPRDQAVSFANHLAFGALEAKTSR